MPPNARNVLLFWFGPLPHAGYIPPEHSKSWFKKDPTFDREIAERFSDLMIDAANGDLDSWSADPQSLLALILLLDQFPRNVHRESPRAFATDVAAAHWARTAVERGLDQELFPIQRVFVYLPLEHSESLPDQELSVRLFTRLVDAASTENRQAFREFLDYSLRHRDIILKFGRFPHRNAVLGRESTAEEIEFLKMPGSGF